VLAGENRGRSLEHEFVVRELAGPHLADEHGIARYEHRFRLDRSWKSDQLRVVAFVQDGVSGEVLQALSGSCPAR
jgi:hypothetical protein